MATALLSLSPSRPPLSAPPPPVPRKLRGNIVAACRPALLRLISRAIRQPEKYDIIYIIQALPVRESRRRKAEGWPRASEGGGRRVDAQVSRAECPITISRNIC